MQKNESESLFYTTYKINLQWIRYLRVRATTIKLLGETIRENLFYKLSWWWFFEYKPKAKMFKQVEYIKLKSFCTVSEKMNKMKWEKICANYVSDKGLMSKIYKE